ncbi:hypothetical protein TeGR_g14189, partial [Tetraparma gracilis]
PPKPPPPSRFSHEGEGSFAPKRGEGKSGKHCHDWKKKGRCAKGDACQFLHEEEKQGGCKRAAPEAGGEARDKKSDADKPCRTWKAKGKCRKGDKCPFMHDTATMLAALARKKQKVESAGAGGKKVAAVEEKPPAYDGEALTLSFSGGRSGELKRSEVEKVLKACDAPKPKRVSVSAERITVMFKSGKAAEEAMMIMWNGVNKVKMGGENVSIVYGEGGGE